MKNNIRSKTSAKVVSNSALKPKYSTIKTKCLHQNVVFKQWADKKKWGAIHEAHYDWWAFPIDRPSSYGSAYQIGTDEFDHLSTDKEFIEALRINSIIVCQAWGWDLIKGEKIITKEKDQKWQDWPVRLYKMSMSLELFKQDDLLRNAVKYGNELIKEKKYFTFRKNDLGEFFIERKHLCSNKKVEE